jgi:hypothetical protein
MLSAFASFLVGMGQAVGGNRRTRRSTEASCELRSKILLRQTLDKAESSF